MQDSIFGHLDDALKDPRHIDPQTGECHTDTLPSSEVHQNISLMRAALQTRYDVAADIAEEAHKALLLEEDITVDDLIKRMLTDERKKILGSQTLNAEWKGLRRAHKLREAAKKWYPIFLKKPKETLEEVLGLETPLNNVPRIELQQGAIAIYIQNDDDYQYIRRALGLSGNSIAFYPAKVPAVPELSGALYVIDSYRDSHKENWGHEHRHLLNTCMMYEGVNVYSKEMPHLWEAKDEILAYMSTESADGHWIKHVLTFDDGGYNYYLESKKKSEGEDAALDEGESAQWEQHKTYVRRLVDEAEEVSMTYGLERALTLLAVTPLQHWKWLVDKTATDDQEGSIAA